MEVVPQESHGVKVMEVFKQYAREEEGEREREG